MARFGAKIMKAIAALQKNPDYEFKEMPMPYDITLMVKNAGTKEAEYQVLPSPKPIPVTEAELALLNKETGTAYIVEQMKKKQAKKEGNLGEAEAKAAEGGIEYPTENINPEDIPF